MRPCSGTIVRTANDEPNPGRPSARYVGDAAFVAGLMDPVARGFLNLHLHDHNVDMQLSRFLRVEKTDRDPGVQEIEEDGLRVP